jgi:hypothetical protein
VRICSTEKEVLAGAFAEAKKNATWCCAVLSLLLSRCGGEGAGGDVEVEKLACAQPPSSASTNTREAVRACHESFFASEKRVYRYS